MTIPSDESLVLTTKEVSAERARLLQNLQAELERHEPAEVSAGGASRNGSQKSEVFKVPESGKFGELFGQDSIFRSINTATGTGVIAIFDGMGGEEEGAESSKGVAISMINNLTREIPSGVEHSEDIEEVLVSAFVNAAATVRKLNTTATVARLWRDKSGEMNVTIASVGDSPAYLIDREGRTTLLNDMHDVLTEDKAITDLDEEPRAAVLGAFYDAKSAEDFLNRIEELHESDGSIPDFDINRYLSYMNFRNVIRKYMGGVPTNITEARQYVSLSSHRIESGQRLVLMSDGISDPLPPSKIGEIVAKSKTTSDTVKSLIDSSNSNREEIVPLDRRKSDDKSVIVYSLEDNNEVVRDIVKERGYVDAETSIETDIVAIREGVKAASMRHPEKIDYGTDQLDFFLSVLLGREEGVQTMYLPSKYGLHSRQVLGVLKKDKDGNQVSYTPEQIIEFLPLELREIKSLTSLLNLFVEDRVEELSKGIAALREQLEVLETSDQAPTHMITSDQIPKSPEPMPMQPDVLTAEEKQSIHTRISKIEAELNSPKYNDVKEYIHRRDRFLHDKKRAQSENDGELSIKYGQLAGGEQRAAENTGILPQYESLQNELFNLKKQLE